MGQVPRSFAWQATEKLWPLKNTTGRIMRHSNFGSHGGLRQQAESATSAISSDARFHMTLMARSRHPI